jgi:hypothetical protein
MEIGRQEAQTGLLVQLALFWQPRSEPAKKAHSSNRWSQTLPYFTGKITKFDNWEGKGRTWKWLGQRHWNLPNPSMQVPEGNLSVLPKLPHGQISFFTAILAWRAQTLVRAHHLEKPLNLLAQFADQHSDASASPGSALRIVELDGHLLGQQIIL